MAKETVSPVVKTRKPRAPRVVDPAIAQLKMEFEIKAKALTIAGKLNEAEENAVVNAILAKREARAKAEATPSEPFTAQ